MSPESPRPAGWYDDESDASRLRYWDGTAWSPHTTPRPSDAPASPKAPAAASATSASPSAPVAPVAPVAPSTPVGPASPPASTAPPAFPAAPAFDGIDEATTARPLRATPASAEPPIATMPAPPERGIDEHTTAPMVPDQTAAAPPPTHGGLGGFGTPVPPPPPYGDQATSAPGFSYEPYQAAGRTFLATWLFALLLGFWGADRVYLGKIGTAIAKLLTLGGLGVWVLVDLLLVLTGAQRDRDGRALIGYEEHRKIAWIVSGALVAFGLLSTIVSNVIAFSMR